ncbi:hypothetical protein [Gaiella occulta]|nr:hypothetical protein [Gaiella occulta]
MMKKRKIFRTPEERAAWVARGEELQRELQYWIERGKAELAARQEPASSP